VARHADIWHSFPLPIGEYRRKRKLVDELAGQAGRDGAAIERSIAAAAQFTLGFDRRRADEFLDAGVPLFTVEMQPHDGGDDFEPLEQAIAWRGGAAR
jgi:alkanesulfonate monooxygenase SsuD/methylene tetrahydromethanopterin reductase-like flavin-dependent oxidoreductase (luciferase family)